MNTSYSALESFKSCPLKYKFQNIDKLKTPKGASAIFGSAVHRTMEFIHSGQFVLPTEKDALNHFSSKWNSDLFEDSNEERAAFAQGINIIKGYYKKFKPADAKIIALESRFSIPLEDEDGKTTHLISGIIDRIDKTETGYEIIDYKTSRRLPAQNSIDNNLQLLIYLLAFINRYPEEKKNIKNIKLSLFFLHHQTKLTTTLSQEQLDSGKIDIVKLIGKIEKSDFPPVVNSLCDWCGYQSLCPMWKHKFKDKKTTPEEQKKIINKYLEINERMKQDRRKIAELKSKVLEIMESEEVQRLFGEDKIIQLSFRQNLKYDEEKLRKFLGEENWEKVTRLNLTDLNRLLPTLSSAQQQAIEKIQAIKSETKNLRVSNQK